ncbi:hypothetical protein GCM10023324_34890 [Streptomyces youssoufiensis]
MVVGPRCGAPPPPERCTYVGKSGLVVGGGMPEAVGPRPYGGPGLRGPDLAALAGAPVTTRPVHVTVARAQHRENRGEAAPEPAQWSRGRS